LKSYRRARAWERPWFPTAAIWEGCSGQRIWRFIIRIPVIGRWRRCCCGVVLMRHFDASVYEAAAPSLLAGGVAVVYRNAGAGDRSGASGRTGDGGSLHLFPSVGMFILTVWGVYELTRHWRHNATVLSLAAAAALVLCMALTRQQLGYWQDSETLFRYTLKVTQNNYIAHDSLGNAVF